MQFNWEELIQLHGNKPVPEGIIEYYNTLKLNALKLKREGLVYQIEQLDEEIHNYNNCNNNY